MAKRLTAAVCVASLVPRLAAQAQVEVQLATAIAYSDQACTMVDKDSPREWAVNLCSPYPVQVSGMEHKFGSMIYEVKNDRLVERKFQSVDCSGPEHSQSPRQLGPMVGGRGSCVPISGSGDSQYANSITLNASSRNSFLYVPVFSDQRCSTGYGVYMLDGPISDKCSLVPAGQSLPPAIPNTTGSYIQKCDSSDMDVTCTYDSADCSGQPNQCVPSTALSSSGTCSSRASNWGSMYVYKGPRMCPGKVKPGTMPSPMPSPAPLTCLDVKKMYQAQRCCDKTKASQVFQWSAAPTPSPTATAGRVPGRRLSDIKDEIEGLLSMVQAEEGKDTASQVAAQFVKVAETFTGH